jgi:hypothetical protein
MKPMIFSTPSGLVFGTMSTSVSEAKVRGASTASTVRPAMPPREAPIRCGRPLCARATASTSSAKRRIW